MGLRYSFERCIRFLNWAQLGGGKDDGWRFESFQFQFTAVWPSPARLFFLVPRETSLNAKSFPPCNDLAIHNGLGPLTPSRVCAYAHVRGRLSHLPGRAAKSISEVGPIDPKQWGEFATNLPLLSRRLRKRGILHAARQAARGGRSSQEPLRQPPLPILSTPPEVYRDIVEHLGRAGSLARVRRILGCAHHLRNLSDATWLPA